jgi:hypothetical protein
MADDKSATTNAEPTTETSDVDVEQLSVRTAADFKTIYANNVSLMSGVFDFAITVGEVIDGASFERKCRIVMSPQMAKAFMLSVISQVRLWEKSFGTINLPADLISTAKPPKTNVSSSEPEQPPSQSPSGASE